MKLYKILVNSKSCHGGDLQWSLPKKKGSKWIAGDWHEVSGEPIVCKRGLHLTSKPFNWYKWGCTCYEAEYKGDIQWEGDKCAVSKARLLKEVGHPKWWTDVEGWIPTLKKIAWLKPDGKPKKEWKLFETRDAAWDAAWVAARDVARDAAWDAAGAAVGDATWDAARDAAGAAVGAAAGDAARAAVGAAAGDAVGDATWDAARDAALYAQTTFVCDGLKLAEKHRTHVKKRMEVWQKGYGLLCDVGGVLYVYKKL